MLEVVIAVVVVFVVLALISVTRSGPRISGEEARKLVADGAILLDVRSPGEFSSGHIDGALNIPVGELPSRVGELGAPGKPIVVYCASGMRSANAARILRGKGHEEVHNLGGMASW